MGTRQSEKLVQDLELFKQLILGDRLTENARMHIFPALDHKAEISTVLFGLNYTFEQLNLHDSNTNEEEHGQLFFWVKQPKACEDSVFNENMMKICSYYQIVSKCAVSIQNHKAKIEMIVNEESSEITVAVKDAAKWVLSSFIQKFKNESSETFGVTYANEYVVIAEPQTNMGRMARQLQANQLIKVLNLTKTNLPDITV